MQNSQAPDWTLAELIQNEVEDALKSRGDVNLIVAGKTGVGKSTLVNAVFQGKLAATGQGEPVTQNTREITKEGIPVSLFDTRGLELDDYDETVDQLESLVKQKSQDPEPKNHIHAAWICIAEDSRRVEEGEIKLADMLSRHMPVIGVITKARSDNGFRQEVQNLLPSAKNVVRVRALSETLDDGHILSPMGLSDLVELTMEIVPEGQKNAFAAAQKVKLQQKVNRAHKAVAVASTSAAGVAATPIPFSDAFALVPIQVGMLARISSVFGISVTKAFLSTLISSALAGSAGTLGGRAIVSGLLKMIPGAGSVAGGVIAAGTATALTVAFGEAYISALKTLLQDDPDKNLSPEEVAKTFKEKLSASDQFAKYN